MEVIGAVKVKNIPQIVRSTDFTQLIKALVDNMVLEIPDTITNVVVDVSEPIDTDNVWIARNSSGSIIGIKLFVGGEWVQMFPPPDSTVRIHGNSNTPPSGYALITTDTPGYSAAEVAFLESRWFRDPTGTFWTIFDVVYVGQ